MKQVVFTIDVPEDALVSTVEATLEDALESIDAELDYTVNIKDVF